MASIIATTRVQGLCVPDPRVTNDNVTAQGAGNTDSDFTQAGALPGVPVADQTTSMALQGSGSQTDKGDIEVYTQRAGGPGLEQGGFLFRDVAASDSTSQYSGWDGYQAVGGVETIYAGNGSAGGSLTTAARLPDGTVLLAHETAAGALRVLQYDPSDSTWTTRVADLVIPGGIATNVALSLVYDPVSKLLLLFLVSSSGRNLIMAKSADEGFTFSVGSYQVLRTDIAVGATIKEIRAAYNNDQVVLFVQYTTSGAVEELAQYASTDRGANFDQVTSVWGVDDDLPDAVDVAALLGGGFLVVYADGQASNPRYSSRRIGSAFEDATNSAVVVIVAHDPGGRPSITVWEDEDGTVYCLAAINEGSTLSTSLFRSADQGDSWEAWGGPVAELKPGATTAEFNDFAAVSTGGLCLFLTKYTVPNENDGNSALLCLYLGGHGSHTLPATDEAVGGTPAVVTNFPDTQFISWAQSDENGKGGGFWFGAEAPDQLSWTKTGAGTGAVQTSLEFRMTTSSSLLHYAREVQDANSTTMIVEVEVSAISGGSTSTKAIAMTITLSDYNGSPSSATYTLVVSLRVTTTGFAFWDDNATTIIGSAVTLNMTSPRKIRMVLSSGRDFRSWYTPTTSTRQRTIWTPSETSSTLNTTHASVDVPSRIEFGNAISGTAVSEWHHVGYCFWGSQWAAGSDTATGLAEAWVNPTDLHPRSYTPLPALVHDGLKIAAVDGPSLVAETWRITPEHTYALSNIFPDASPSPRRGWRSINDNVLQEIVIKLDADFADTRLSGSTLFIGLFESNLETVVFETYDGASWDTHVTIDSTTGWTGLKYDQRGGTVAPNPGQSTTGAQYFWFGAHVGDTVDLGTGTPADNYHRVSRNTEGAWIGNATTKKPTLFFERDNLPAGLSTTSTGTMVVRRKDFGVIFHSYGDTHQYLRIRIPAHNTVDNHYRIGTLVIGHVAVFGKQYDRGWSVTRENNVSLTTRAGGTRRGRKRGPSRRVFEMSWAETAVDSSRVQDANPDPDYIIGQTSVALAIATPFDTIQMIEGVVEQQGGSTTPVVLITQIPTDSSESHQLTDSRVFVLGRLESDIRLENVLGDEGTSELNRIGNLTLREEV